MEKRFSSFDAQIRDTYEGHVEPFEEASWEQLSGKLSQIAPRTVNYTMAFSGALAVVGLVFLTLAYTLSDNGKSKNELAIAQVDSTAVKTAAPTPTNAQLPAVSDDAKKTDHLADSTEFQGKSEELNTAEVDSVSTISALSGHKETIASKAIISSGSADKGGKVKTTESIKSDKKITHSNTLPKGKIIENETIITGTDASNKRAIHTSCKGLTIQFEASQEYSKDAKFLWNFGDGFFSNEANPAHTFNKAGTFDVSLSVTSYTTGQITSNVVQASIEVLEVPRARTSIQVTSPDMLRIENVSIGDENSELQIDGEVNDNADVALVPIGGNVERSVKLMVQNQSGCTDSLSHYMTFASDANLYIIDQVADALFAPFKEGKLYIFNATDGTLTHTSADGQGWDASGQKGQFIYVHTLENGEKIEVKKGKLAVQ